MSTNLDSHHGRLFPTHQKDRPWAMGATISFRSVIAETPLGAQQLGQRDRSRASTAYSTDACGESDCRLPSPLYCKPLSASQTLSKPVCCLPIELTGEARVWLTHVVYVVSLALETSNRQKNCCCSRCVPACSPGGPCFACRCSYY